jgi:hypothetical protein
MDHRQRIRQILAALVHIFVCRRIQFVSNTTAAAQIHYLGGDLIHVSMNWYSEIPGSIVSRNPPAHGVGPGLEATSEFDVLALCRLFAGDRGD